MEIEVSSAAKSEAPAMESGLDALLNKHKRVIESVLCCHSLWSTGSQKDQICSE